MALRTLGTAAGNSLEALLFSPSMVAADFASLQQAIKFDGVEGSKTVPGALDRAGFLHVPRRGLLRILPGDFIGVDNLGWPILVSAASIASGVDWDNT